MCSALDLGAWVMLVLAYRDLPSRRAPIMAMVAYACRYGHQDRDRVLGWTIDEISEFNGHLADILRAEAPGTGEDR